MVERRLERLLVAQSGWDDEAGHLVWTGGKNRDGDGVLRWQGETWLTRDVAWLVEHREIPEGHTIEATCGVGVCVYPEHLYPKAEVKEEVRADVPAMTVNLPSFGMTVASEVIVGVGKGGVNRLKTHCKRGHEFTEENTYWRKDGRGRMGRACKACVLESNRKSAENRGGQEG